MFVFHHNFTTQIISFIYDFENISPFYRAFGDKSKPPVLPETTSSTDDLHHDEDSNTAQGEDIQAPSQEEDHCEKGQGSEQQTAGEENSREREEDEDLAMSADQLSLEEQGDVLKEESLDHSPAGMIVLLETYFPQSPFEYLNLKKLPNDGTTLV